MATGEPGHNPHDFSEHRRVHGMPRRRSSKAEPVERIVTPGDLATPSTKPTFMQQRDDLKARHPGVLVLFRVGDFYEFYGSEATAFAEIFGLTLTQRDGIDMAVFPNQVLEATLRKMLEAGLRVAIAEEVK
jgi:hypothetical protein